MLASRKAFSKLEEQLAFNSPLGLLCLTTMYQFSLASVVEQGLEMEVVLILLALLLVLGFGLLVTLGEVEKLYFKQQVFTQEAQVLSTQEGKLLLVIEERLLC